jgi:uncharacterized protein (TIRG00374 family)
MSRQGLEGEKSSPENSAKKLSVIRYAGLTLFIWLLLTLDWSQAGAILRNADPGLLLIAGAFNFLFIFLKAYRWHSILRVQGLKYTFLRSQVVYQAGSFFSVVTPGRVGDVIKISYLKNDLGVPYRKGIASVLMDRIMDLATLFLSVLLASLVIAVPLSFLLPLIFVGTCLLILLFIITVPSAIKWILSLLVLVPLTKKLMPNFVSIISESRESLIKLVQKKLAFPFFVSLVAYIAIYAGSMALAHSQNLNVSFIQIVYFISITSLVALIPISVSGVGTREVAMMALFSSQGLGSAEAVVFSVSYLVINLVFANFLGAIFWFSNPLKGSTPDEKS